MAPEVIQYSRYDGKVMYLYIGAAYLTFIVNHIFYMLHDYMLDACTIYCFVVHAMNTN